MVLKLNEAYEKKTLHYMCNGCGEANDPFHPGNMKLCRPEEVMYAPELDLYNNYWTDSSCMYVLRMGDVWGYNYAAMGLSYLFDCDFIRYIADKVGLLTDLTDEQVDRLMPLMFKAITRAAEIFNREIAPGCDIYIGEYTDPTGHEMLVVVPYESRDKIETYCKALNDELEDVVTNLFLAECRSFVESKVNVVNKTFTVTYSIKGAFTTKVVAANSDEALKLASTRLSTSYFGAAQNISGEPVVVEGENGTIAWKK